jgi:hypothetical protein
MQRRVRSSSGVAGLSQGRPPVAQSTRSHSRHQASIQRKILKIVQRIFFKLLVSKLSSR